MKKLLGLLLLPLLFACGTEQSHETVAQQIVQAVQPTEAEATTLLGNPDPMSVACATGFTRRLPNFCQRDVWGTNTLLSATVCTLQDITGAGHGVPATAKAAMLLTSKVIVSANVVANRSVSTDIFSDSGCATRQIRTNLTFREEVATVAGTTLIDAQSIHPIVPLFSGSFAYLTLFTTCVNCLSAFNVIGYYD